MNLTLESIVQRINFDVAETEFEGNIVLMHIENGKYYNLNATSSDLWRWLEEKTLVTDLVAKLCAKYDCSHNLAKQDVFLFLQHLFDINLLYVNSI